MNLSQTSVSPTTNLTLEMAKGFRNSGCDCQIIELAPKEPRDAMSPFTVMVPPREHHYQMMGWSSLLYTFDIIKGLSRFKSLLREESRSPETSPLVFMVTLYPVWVLNLAVFCRMRRIPVFAYIFEEWISLHLYDDISLLKKVMGSIRRIPSALLLYGVCTRMVTGVAVIVDEMQHFLVRRFKVDANKVFCFPNVVSGEQLSSTSVKQLSSESTYAKSSTFAMPTADKTADRAGDGDPPTLKLRRTGQGTERYVVFGGALSFTKDAMSKTLEGLGVLKSRGVVIGLRIYGKVGMRQQQRLLSEAQQLKIADQIRLMGYVERTVLEQDLQQAVGALIIKCDTPFNRYNFPTKMMDALKMRVPVIASTGNLFKKYFIDRVSACLVNPNSASEIADAIQYLAEHPKEARQMADQAHKLLEDEFNAEAVCKRFFEKFGFGA